MLNFTALPPHWGRCDLTTEEQLDAVVGLLGEVLGESLVGVYLHGSSVLGGLRPQSDLDVLAVGDRPLTHEEKRALAARLLGISLRPRPIELTVVSEQEVRPWRYPPSVELKYGDWLRAEFDRGEVEPSNPTPDLAILISIALQGKAGLVGPPPEEVFDPVPWVDVADSMTRGIAELLGDFEWDTRNVLLTLVRIWCSLSTGEIRTKDAAAEWALSRLPPVQRSAVERARAVYLGEQEEGHWDAASARHLAEHLVREIKRML
jgi:predicted nucleotidyltransferase